jgi:hypothetical protein
VNSSPPGSQSDSAAGAMFRWRTCLHEAGHAIAGRRLSDRVVRAIVFDDNSGGAYINSERAIPVTFDEALAIAAGREAESLAGKYDPPQAPPEAPLEEKHPEAVKDLKEQLRASLPDARAIAYWCVGGVEEQPERWVNRFHWIRHEAWLFVAGYQRQIVEAATGLFVRGIITLPAEPAEKGTAHVDRVGDAES